MVKNNIKKYFSVLVIALIVLSVFLSLFLWFFPHKGKTYYTVLPVCFNDSNLPYTEVVIQGIRYPVVIDLGSYVEIKLHAGVIEKIHAHPCGTEQWVNFLGEKFEHSRYILPKVKVGSLVFNDPLLTEYFLEEEEKGLIWRDPTKEKKPPKTVGYLGRNLLKKVNLLFDMQRSRIIATNHLEKLKDEGYAIDSFIKAPFILTSKGIIIEVDTDLGNKKLMLDTGFTYTMLHNYLYPKGIEKKVDHRGFPVVTSKKFIVNGTDFGSKELYFLSMTEELREIDGVIGMDFIRNHVIYIDFSKKLLYIQEVFV